MVLRVVMHRAVNVVVKAVIHVMEEHLTAARVPLNHQGLRAEALLVFFRISAHHPPQPTPHRYVRA